MIRLFAALAVPGDIAEALSLRQGGLAEARWRPLEALHITLRFFGDLAEDRADDLDLALSQVRGPPMALELQGVGAFGEGDDIHAVWAGVKPNPALDQLARRCETAARRAGLKADTPRLAPARDAGLSQTAGPGLGRGLDPGQQSLEQPRFPPGRLRPLFELAHPVGLGLPARTALSPGRRNGLAARAARWRICGGRTN